MKNYQDAILNQLRRDENPITMFLTNGFQIRGIVKGFDNYVIIVESENKQQMIYKSAISTIIPLRSISNLLDIGKKANKDIDN